MKAAATPTPQSAGVSADANGAAAVDPSDRVDAAPTGESVPPPAAQPDRIDRALLMDLLTERGGPCISVLMPTERSFPASQQNPIRLRNLIRRAAELFDPAQQVHAEPLLAPLRALLDDDAFWQHPADALALYSAPGYWRALKLAAPLGERVHVNASFHVKPLLRLQRQGERFHVLALNRERLRLLEGDRVALREIEPPAGVPRTLEDALGSEIRERGADNYAYDGPGGRGKEASRVAGGARAGSNAQAQDIDTERFFRAVDRAIVEHVSRRTPLPLVLAALPAYQAHFRKLTHNPHLAEAGIDINPDALSVDELRVLAADALRPQFERQVDALCDRFGAAFGAHRGDDRLPQVAVAAAAGRVDCLLLEAERRVPGHLDPASGAFIAADLDDPQAEDLLDDIAEQVLRLGGEVVVLPPERMPSRTGLAAIYRY